MNMKCHFTKVCAERMWEDDDADSSDDGGLPW